MIKRRIHFQAVPPFALLVVVLAGAPVFMPSPGQALQDIRQSLVAETDKDFGAIIPLDTASGMPLNKVPFDVDFYFSIPKGDNDQSVEYRLIEREYDSRNCEELLRKKLGVTKIGGPATVAGSSFLLQMPPLSPNQRYCLGIEKLSRVTDEAQQQPGFRATLNLATNAAVDAIGDDIPAVADSALVTRVNQAIVNLDLPFQFRVSITNLQIVFDEVRERVDQLAQEMADVAREMQQEHLLIQRALVQPEEAGADPCLSGYQYCEQVIEKKNRDQPSFEGVQEQEDLSKSGFSYAREMAEYGQSIIQRIRKGEPLPMDRDVTPADLQMLEGVDVPDDTGFNCDENDERCKEVKRLAERIAETLRATAQLQERISVSQLSTVGGLTVRRNQFLSFDLGYGVAPDIDETFYYATVGVYLRPINKNAPLHPDLVGEEWYSWSQLLRRLSFTIGLTETISASSETSRLKGVVDSKRPLLVGLNWRLTEVLNVGAGGLLFKVVSPNPLDTHEDLLFTPYVSLSLNGDLRALFKGMTEAFTKGQ